MSRPKDSVLKQIDSSQTPRERLNITRYGTKFHGNAAYVVENAANEFYCASQKFDEEIGYTFTEKELKESKALAKRNIDALGVCLAGRLNEAILSGDGSYFRAIADAVEKYKAPANTLETAILSSLNFCTALKHPPKPREINEWVKSICDRWPDLIGNKDQDQLRAIVKLCGLPIKPAKRGRPAKPKRRKGADGHEAVDVYEVGSGDD